jgi:hypothetical protein
MDVRIVVSGGPATTIQMPEAPRAGDQIWLPAGRLQITHVAWVSPGSNQWLLAVTATPAVTPFAGIAEFEK